MHKIGWRWATGRQREYLIAGGGHQNGVLPLRGQRPVFGHDGPPVVHLLDITLTRVDHGLDREGHAFNQGLAGTRRSVVQDLRVLVEPTTDTMATKFTYDAEPVALGEGLNGMADITQSNARLDHDDAFPHGVIGDAAQALGRNRALTNDEHATGITMPTILDHRDIDIDDVTFFQRLIIRNAVADRVIN